MRGAWVYETLFALALAPEMALGGAMAGVAEATGIAETGEAVLSAGEIMNAFYFQHTAVEISELTSVPCVKPTHGANPYWIFTGGDPRLANDFFLPVFILKPKALKKAVNEYGRNRVGKWIRKWEESPELGGRDFFTEEVIK